MVKVKTVFTVLLTVSLLGIAACSDDDGDEGGAGGDETGTSAKEGGEPIRIKTHLAPVNASGETTGEVLSGSTIGDSAFCVGGRWREEGARKRLGDKGIPVLRWHPDDHLHLDTT